MNIPGSLAYLYMEINTEVATRTPGLGWKVRTFKTQPALDRFLARLDSDVEVQFREVE